MGVRKSWKSLISRVRAGTDVLVLSLLHPTCRTVNDNFKVKTVAIPKVMHADTLSRISETVSTTAVQQFSSGNGQSYPFRIHTQAQSALSGSPPNHTEIPERSDS